MIKQEGSAIALDDRLIKVQARAARDGRNPQTGAIVKIAASKKLAFQPAKAVKDRLNA